MSYSQPADLSIDSLLHVADSIVYDDPEASLSIASIVEDRARQLSSDSLLAEALYRKGSAYWSRGDLSSALDELLYAEEILKDYPNVRLGANINRRIGTLYGGVEDNETAIFYNRLAIIGFLKSGDKIGLIGTYNNIGNSFRELRQYDSAEFYLRKALQVLGDDTNFIEPILHFNLAEIYYEKNELDESLEAVETCKLLSESQKNKRGIVRSNQLIAEILLAKGDFEEAEVLAKNAFEMAIGTNSKELIYISANTLAKCFYASRNFDQAGKMDRISRSYEDSIKNTANQNRLDFYRLAKTENELEGLKQQKRIDDLQSSNLKTFNIAIALIASLAIIIAWIFYHGRKFEKEAKAKLEEKNRKIRDQSQELSKLNELKTSLLAIVSHDLKSPIQGLFGILDLLDKKFATPKELERLVPDIKQRLSGTYSKVNDLLNWSSGDLQQSIQGEGSFELKGCLTKAMDDLSSEAERKGISFNTSLNGKLEVLGDQKILKTILRNLISNAIKFSPKDGQISVGVSAGEDRVKVTIGDNGVGIPKEKIQDLFTAKKTPETGTMGEMGSGVGLIICYDLIKLMHGTMWVESELGEGSNFFLSLPIAKASKRKDELAVEMS